MCRICEHHGDIFQEPNTLKQFMFSILTALKGKPRVSSHCCQAIEKLAISFAPIDSNQQENPLTQYFAEILEHLNQNA